MLLSQDEINEYFDTQWTFRIGSRIKMDISKVVRYKWDLDDKGDRVALKVKPALKPEVAAEMLAGYKGPHITKSQILVSDTPLGCSWGVNYLRIPLAPLTRGIAALVLNQIEEYEEWNREMSEAWEGVYDIPHQ